MDKEDILEQAKQQIRLWVENLNLDNLVDHRAEINRCLDFIEQLQTFPVYVETSGRPESGNSEDVSADTSPPKDVFTFARKLRGGYVPELDAPVPERIVRQMYLEDGDKLHLASKWEEGNRTFYTWKIAERRGGQSVHGYSIENRIQYNFCLVERQAGRMIVQSQWNGEKSTPLRHEDSFLSFALRDDDVQEFHIEEGDIIDIATAESHLEFCKVIWKHATEGISQAPPAARRKNHKNTNPPVQSDYLSLPGVDKLAGKQVLIVGCESRKAEFRDAIEKCGAGFEWASGDEARVRLGGMVRKADAVVLLMDVIGHHARWTVGALAKDLNVPFHEVIGYGVTTVIRGAIESLSMNVQGQIA